LRKDVVNAAKPPLNGLVPRVLVPFLKVMTVPFATGWLELTVAVKVIGSPKVEGLPLEVNIVVVGNFTLWASIADTLVRKLLSPL
jgi:hypothetical protein